MLTLLMIEMIFRDDNKLSSQRSSPQYRSSGSTGSQRSFKKRSRPVISIIIDSSSSEDEGDIENVTKLDNNSREHNKDQDENFDNDLEDLFGGILAQVQDMFRQVSYDDDDDNDQGKAIQSRQELATISESQSIDEDLLYYNEGSNVNYKNENEVKAREESTTDKQITKVNETVNKTKEDATADAIKGDEEIPKTEEQVSTTKEGPIIDDATTTANKGVKETEADTSTDDAKTKRVFSEFGEDVVLKETKFPDVSKTSDSTTSKDDSKEQPTEQVTKSQIENVIDDIISILKENLSEEDLTKIMGKIEPMFSEIKEEYNLQASKNISFTTPTTAPAISGPPPPAPPPPPPPPAETGPKIKVRSKGATLTAIPNNGEYTDIEIRIPKPKKGDDMMAQLRERLNKRQNRQSLALKFAHLK